MRVVIVVDTSAGPGDSVRAATIAATRRASGLRAAVDLGDAVATAASRVRYAVETGWPHIIDLAGATLHDTHSGATAAIPSQAITAALDGDGAPLSSILAGRRP